MRSELDRAAILYGVDGPLGICLRSQALAFGIDLPKQYKDLRNIEPWPYFAQEARKILGFDPMFHAQCFRDLFDTFRIGPPWRWPVSHWMRFAREARGRLQTAENFMRYCQSS